MEIITGFKVSGNRSDEFLEYYDKTLGDFHYECLSFLGSVVGQINPFEKIIQEKIETRDHIYNLILFTIDYSKKNYSNMLKYNIIEVLTDYIYDNGLCEIKKNLKKIQKKHKNKYENFYFKMEKRKGGMYLFKFKNTNITDFWSINCLSSGGYFKENKNNSISYYFAYLEKNNIIEEKYKGNIKVIKNNLLKL